MPSTIEWTDETWNPTVGCSIVSEGCRNCYAMRLAGTRLAHFPQYTGITHMIRGKPKWTGRVRPVPANFNKPLSWREPRMVFVNSMSDLFHYQVLPSTIQAVFEVMSLAQRHTFQILTKRPKRMREDLSNLRYRSHENCEPHGLEEEDRCLVVNWSSQPLPNVWLGTSVENSDVLLDRMIQLCLTPAAVRFLSCEPLLGPLWIRPYLKDKEIQWVIAGGESGPGARDMDLQWVRSLRNQCQETGVPFFLKQLGGSHKKRGGDQAILDGQLHRGMPVV